MNNDQLKARLNKLEVPTPLGAHRDQHIEKAVLAFKHNEKISEEVEEHRPVGYFSVFALTVVCLLVVIFIPHKPDLRAGAGFGASMASHASTPEGLFEELNKIIGKSLNALIKSPSSMEILYSGEEEQTASLGLVVLELSKEALVYTVVARVGRNIKARLGQEEINLLVMLNDQGVVSITSGAEHWASTSAGMLRGFSVTARAVLSGGE